MLKLKLELFESRNDNHLLQIVYFRAELFLNIFNYYYLYLFQEFGNKEVKEEDKIPKE